MFALVKQNHPRAAGCQRGVKLTAWNNLQTRSKTNIYRNKSGVGLVLPYTCVNRCQQSTNVVLQVSQQLYIWILRNISQGTKHQISTLQNLTTNFRRGTDQRTLAETADRSLLFICWGIFICQNFTIMFMEEKNSTPPDLRKWTRLELMSQSCRKTWSEGSLQDQTLSRLVRICIDQGKHLTDSQCRAQNLREHSSSDLSTAGKRFLGPLLPPWAEDPRTLNRKKIKRKKVYYLTLHPYDLLKGRFQTFAGVSQFCHHFCLSHIKQLALLLVSL